MQFKNLCWCFSQALSFKLYCHIRLKDLESIFVFFGKSGLKLTISVVSEWKSLVGVYLCDVFSQETLLLNLREKSSKCIWKLFPDY